MKHSDYLQGAYLGQSFSAGNFLGFLGPRRAAPALPAALLVVVVGRVGVLVLIVVVVFVADVEFLVGRLFIVLFGAVAGRVPGPLIKVVQLMVNRLHLSKVQHAFPPFDCSYFLC